MEFSRVLFFSVSFIFRGKRFHIYVNEGGEGVKRVRPPMEYPNPGEWI